MFECDLSSTTDCSSAISDSAHELEQLVLSTESQSEFDIISCGLFANVFTGSVSFSGSFSVSDSPADSFEQFLSAFLTKFIGF
ncbi:hypothetical protein Hanom_Chr11g01009061 [Helianthus anomalus]